MLPAGNRRSVSRIIRRYVGRQAEIKDRIKRLNETRRRT